MKLAEALIIRSDLQKRIEQLRVRLARSAKVQEGDEPPERPDELLAELERLLADLERIIRNINRTNASTPFDGDRTIADALAERDVLGLRRNLLNEVIENASIKQDRYSKSEVKFCATIDIPKLQREVDRLSKAYRELDTRIQEINWKTDLLE